MTARSVKLEVVSPATSIVRLVFVAAIVVQVVAFTIVVIKPPLAYLLLTITFPSSVSFSLRLVPFCASFSRFQLCTF